MAGTRLNVMGVRLAVRMKTAVQPKELTVDVLDELFPFVKTRRKVCLLPIIVLMVLLRGLLLAQGSVFAPFVYTLS
jgi:hypothetical protein